MSIFRRVSFESARHIYDNLTKTTHIDTTVAAVNSLVSDRISTEFTLSVEFRNTAEIAGRSQSKGMNERKFNVGM